MRRLLVIDSNVTMASPSMRCWLTASGCFREHFDEVEVWANVCELSGPEVKFVPVKFVRLAGPLNYFLYLAEIRRRFRNLPPGYLQETLVQCTGSMLPFADIRFIHFWDTAFMELAGRKKELIRLNLKDRIFRGIGVKTERAALLPGATKAWWCVSRGISQPIAQADRSGAVMRFLPNSFDAARFNHEMRKRWRSAMRAQYGLAEDEVVFCFSSFGHYERKGLLQAAAAVNLLNERGFKVRLLVLGGRARTIDRFKKSRLARSIQWEHLIFAGMVTEMEKHLAAGDALLFPSHFEAFSLVEIEAAAMGLRLYLTAHPGHEMILRENVNGRLLPWEVAGMADVLAAEISSGAIHAVHDEIGEAAPPAQYKVLLAGLFQEAIARKWHPQETAP